MFEQNLHRVAGNLDKGLFLIVLVQLLVTGGALVLPPIAPCVAEGFGVEAYVVGYQGGLFFMVGVWSDPPALPHSIAMAGPSHLRVVLPIGGSVALLVRPRLKGGG
ncbi:hypothetical protein SmB9_17800 [Sphingosinicella microcystinivorans]|uniref:Uncharacterized protein n=1 Tax=Sphingosinicella microcystinivorans TaxID=335406 RepID=A0AAD1G0Q7_SPHMI|nr:hypothetical protein SmB9_17800 [Sphingosinicella microcystinivorans]